QNTYTFSQADTIFQFAKNHQMVVHGHTLIWHGSTPNWVTNGNFTKDQLIAVMADHIATVVGRYKGGIAIWDVVNEALDTSGNLRSSIWKDTIGPEYIDLAHIFAHDADRDCLLVLNDWGIETVNPKSNGLYNLALSMLERGVPLH